MGWLFRTGTRPPPPPCLNPWSAARAVHRGILVACVVYAWRGEEKEYIAAAYGET
jgi:hypothetical protein